MPYAIDRKDKMFTAYNLNTLYSRFDAKCHAALNEMGPLWAQSRWAPYDHWAAPFPYGVWYVLRQPCACMTTEEFLTLPSLE